MVRPELGVDRRLAEMILWFDHFTPEQAARVENERCPGCRLNAVSNLRKMSPGDVRLICETLDARNGWRDAAIKREELMKNGELEGHDLKFMDPLVVRFLAACLRRAVE